MNVWTTSSIIFIWLVSLLPFLLGGTLSVLGVRIRERWVTRVVRLTTIAGLLATIGLSIQYRLGYIEWSNPIVLPWIRSPFLTYDIVLGINFQSLFYIGWSWIIVGAIGRFSSVYLAGSRSYQKFMLLLLLLQWGFVTVILAGRFELLMMGWEVVGIASVLLIGFVQDTKFSGNASLVAFVSYKLSDIGLLLAGVLLHHLPQVDVPYFFGVSSDFALNWKTGGYHLDAFFLGSAIVVASLAKGSQFPFVSWLPRAMEGPTPSSAAFYGALSVHLGPILLLKLRPFWGWSPVLVACVLSIGLLTLFFGALVGRTTANNKMQLAYAIMIQLGIIYVEVALNFSSLAMWHICSHGALRTFQFLRAGSILGDFAENPFFYNLHASATKIPPRNPHTLGGKLMILISGLINRMYAYAWNEFYFRQFLSWLTRLADSTSSFKIVRFFNLTRSFGLLGIVLLGRHIFSLDSALVTYFVLFIGSMAVINGLSNPHFEERIKILGLAHLAILSVCLETGILSHDFLLILNGVVMFSLVGVAYKMARVIKRQLPSALIGSRNMGLAEVFPQQATLFLGIFLILGIAPGSLLFVMEDILLEHLLAIGFLPLALFLCLGFFLAVFLYRTYVQVFMGFDAGLRGIRGHDDQSMIIFGRVLLVVSVAISLLPQGLGR